MSVKEIEIATPTTSDLSHDETSADSTVSLKKQLSEEKDSMSTHNLSTPVASPPPPQQLSAVPTTTTPNSSNPVTATSTANAISSPPPSNSQDVPMEDAPHDDDDDDDEDDDLFNEPATEPLKTSSDSQVSTKPSDEPTSPSTEAKETPQQAADKSTPPFNDSNDLTNNKTPTKISNDNDTSAKPATSIEVKSEDASKLSSSGSSASSSASSTSTAQTDLNNPPDVSSSSSPKRTKPLEQDETAPVKRPRLDDYVKTEVVKNETATQTPTDPRDPPEGAPRQLAKHQAKFALASLRAVKRLKDAGPFIDPVDDVKLNIPTYYTVVKHPMDLSTMEHKVTGNLYTSVSEFISDMSLIVSNCVLFNGPESFISNMARNIKASFDKHMNNMPPYEQPAPNSNSRPKKKTGAGAKNQRVAATARQSASPAPPAAVTATSSNKAASTPTAASPAKSKSSKAVLASNAAASASNNTSTTSTTTPVSSKATSNPNPSVSSKGPLKKVSPAAEASKPFALQPSGIPTIRRDSSVDGRPKREIHPPKSKDLPYGDFKPRKKKHAAELRFCGGVLKDLMSKKHETFNFPFLQPVDPVALNCPSYFKVIKHPMDLSTIQQKFNTNQYETAELFEEDVRLMFRNCYKFNPEGSPVNLMGHRLEALFDQKWAERPVPAPSPPPIPVESESEEESDLSDSELIRDDPGIKYLEAQLERMKKDLEKMKREALQKAREARDARKRRKKKANGSAGGSKRGAKEGGGAGTTRRKSASSGAGPGRRASNANGVAASGSAGSSSSLSSQPLSGNATNVATAAANNAPTAYVTYEMKEELSRMCQTLPEKKMRHVLKLIQEGMPNLNTDNQEEVELEIDQLNPATVLKLYDYVVKAKRPRANSTTKRSANNAGNAPATGTGSPGPGPKRKGKPISEAEQTRQIEELQKKIEQFDRAEEQAAAASRDNDYDGMSDNDVVYVNDGSRLGSGSGIAGDGSSNGLGAGGPNSSAGNGASGSSSGGGNGGGHDLMVSASGAGMALAGGRGPSMRDSDDDDDDDDGGSDSSSEEE